MRLDKRVYDVIIVGSGPAGCAAALGLPGDFKVLMVDASKLLGEKVCAGLLNPEAKRLLGGLDMPDTVLDAPGRLFFRYVDADRSINKEIQLHLSSASRPKLGAWLASLVPDHIELWPDAYFLGYRDYGRYVEVEVKRGAEHMTLISRYLIGADGARSMVRKQMSAHEPQYYTVIQDWIKAEKPLPPYFDFIYSGSIGQGYVYGYIVPKGRLTLVGSVFAPGAQGITTAHDRAKKLLKDKIGRFGHLSRRESGVVLNVRSVDDIIIGKGSVLLAGEAAGLVSTTSGQGISYALRSGEACGRAFWGTARPSEQYAQFAAPLIDDIRSKLGKLRFVDGRVSHAVAAHMPPRFLSWIGKKLA